MKNIFVILKNEERAWVSAIDHVPEEDYIIFITLTGPNSSKEAQDKSLALIRKDRAYLEYGKMIPKSNDENLALVDRVVQYQDGGKVTFDVETKKKIAVKIIETIEKRGSKTDTTVHLIGKARNTYSGDFLKAYNRKIYGTLHKALNEVCGMQLEEPTEPEQVEQAKKPEQAGEQEPRDRKNTKPSGGMRMQTHASGLQRGKNVNSHQRNNSRSDDMQGRQSTGKPAPKKESAPKGAGRGNDFVGQFENVEGFEQWRENNGQSQSYDREKNERSSQNRAPKQSEPSERPDGKPSARPEPKRSNKPSAKAETDTEKEFSPDVTFTESPFPLLPPKENLIEGDHKKLDKFLLGNTSDRTPEIKSAENLVMIRYLEKFRELFSQLLENNPISVEFYIRDWHRIIDLAYRAEDENDFLESVSTLYNAINIPAISPAMYARLKYHAQRYIEICSIVYKQIERPSQPESE